jgi:hypothetical protein
MLTAACFVLYVVVLAAGIWGHKRFRDGFDPLSDGE